MQSKYIPENIQVTLERKALPTIVMWNRLEGRPRTHHFNKALKAEVRDALWMLTRQWQMGEFKADDAGSPVFARVHATSTGLDTYKASDKPLQPFNDNVPLEAKVEQKKIPFTREDKPISIDIRLQMGKYWQKMIAKEGLNFSGDYISYYKIEIPPPSRSTDYVYAHSKIWQQYAAISGRCMDGYKFYEYITKAGNSPADNITNDPGEINSLQILATHFIEWYRKLFYQPLENNDDAWIPNQLEYQFACGAATSTDQKTLTAEEYYNGHLDWYAFNIEQGAAVSNAEAKTPYTDTLIPAHVQFDGMPNTRWWQFEDSKTDLGDVQPSSTDLAKLLLVEFGLVFANDWFIIPYTLPGGSLSNIEGLAVRNNFGETTWIKATEEENSNETWSMFKLQSSKQNNTLLLAPVAAKIHSSEPLEEILFIRDEMANMVWGIETRVPTPLGHGDKGGETALRTLQYHEKFVPPPLNDSYKAPISYLAMTSVPENWIPFIPVHIPNSIRATQIQRASLTRAIDNDTPDNEVKIKPLTSILREGLDAPVPSSYYIHEEEIPRAGAIVTQCFQRTRWHNGEVFVWLGMQKSTGRGEGSSGLGFDLIHDARKKE